MKKKKIYFDQLGAYLLRIRWAYRYCCNMHLIINMSHKQKLQHFRVQIRTKEISHILARKRLFQDNQPQSCNTFPQLQPLNLYLIMQIAKMAQFQQNVEQLHHIGWPKELKKYLSPDFNYSQQQIWASSALSNLLFVSDCQQPSPSFTQNILQILSGNSSTQVLTNVLILLFNLAHDYKDWVDNLVRNQNLIERLSLIFGFQNINHSLLSELILTICKILKRASFSDKMFELSQPILNLVTNNIALDPLLLPPTLYCLCQLAQRFSKEIGQRIVQIKFFKKMAGIIKVLTDPKTIEFYVTLAINTLEQLTAETFQSQIFPNICQKLQIAPRLLKLKIYRLIYYALQQNKLDIRLFQQQSIFLKIFAEYEFSDDIAILEQLSYIFCICLLNLKLKSQQVLNFVQALKRAKKLMYEKIEVQGFIQETLVEYERLSSI